ncbi:phosphatidylserine/phosphatidylglycerophosphate/cardiolipin synthase [Paraburkholderia tropica]|uniref:phosphatidylserine/phosphatidylglycerophosphate/ cardiolipin synthase n=1 Tax=Paraburkholderia tropica TaxID=92647 RepID=UPI00161A7E9F|nr:phosphatidylserine/phosphatidylglycerophosphate/cardiolipin synthase [Paraburkholderia tropica]MBB6320534.1 hypothetical protein [Paraburkholderia tropica]
MSVFGITGIRIDDHTGVVTHVRWGQINPKNNSWFTEPVDAPVTDVVNAIVNGDEVWTIIPVAGAQTALGPRVHTMLSTGGLEGIAVPPDTPDDRSFDVLPKI